MLPTAIPLSGIPITMPDAMPEAVCQSDGLPASLLFKDLLLGIQVAEGKTLQPSKTLDPVIAVAPKTAASDAGTSVDISSLVANDDGVLLPTLQAAQNGSDNAQVKASQASSVPQASSNTTEKDMVQPDNEAQVSCPSIPQADVDETQVAITPPEVKKLVAGKADRKTDDSPVKTKSSSRPIATSGGAVAAIPVAPTEVVAMKTNSAMIDHNTPGASAPVIPVISATVTGTAKLLQETATVKARTDPKWPVPTAQVAPQKSEVADQVNQVVTPLSSATDDQDISHGAGIIENTPKMARIPGSRESSFVASTLQPAAIFHASLVRETKSTGSLTVSDDDSILTPADTQMPSAISGPVNHLDLQWKDGALGDVSVHAEMREGVLHAVVNSSHVGSAVSPTELHQFLEDSRIPVHSLQVNGVEGVKHIPEAGQFDANTASGNGTQSSLSYRDESSRSSARDQELRHKAANEDEVGPVTVPVAPMTHAVQPQVNRLSIHI